MRTQFMIATALAALATESNAFWDKGHLIRKYNSLSLYSSLVWMM